MTQENPKARGEMPLADRSFGVRHIALRLLGLAFVDAIALWFLYNLVRDNVWPLVAVLSILTLAVNIIFLREDLYPLRWLSPGLALLTLMALYPLLFTIYTAFTNYSDGHLLTKQQVINLLGRTLFLPEGGQSYSWVAFRSPQGEFALWLTSEDGENLIAFPGETQQVGPGTDLGEVDEDGVPLRIDGFERLRRADSVRYLPELTRLDFGDPPDTVRIRNLNAAAQLQPRYVFDPDLNAIRDQSTGILYFADENQGVFRSEEGQTLTPGYYVLIGLDNFKRLVSSPALRGPFIRIFLWTFAFALLSVLTTFALGLFLALVFDDPAIRGRKIIRSLLIIPYAIPGVIGILVWRGMLNPNLGVISTTLRDLFGWSPPWLSDAIWAKVAILLINLWLGYPYMMLIASGALQSIPQDLYEAAKVDGASTLQRFWGITMPLLLVAVGPLLIASFSYNFNNFNVIYLFNQGGPPIPNSPTPAGHTDILISYTYRLAFAGQRGSDYGYAAAIAFVIFTLVAIITIFNFRYTRVWEEVSESV
jgi:arabinogalactan oligomer / maltooligosaccharide transport system permease protein